jgi:geranylgeranyl diphosphate synthase, type II
MFTLKECQDLIHDQLKKISLPASPSNLYDPIRYMLEPDGKRIRPALVLMGCNVFADDVKQALYPAMAIEVFHNFTLMHDDIMDNASMRRNRHAVHVKWSPNIALLSGDAMMIKAYELLSITPSAVFPAVFELFNQTALKVCEGQQYDMDFERRLDITQEDYLHMVGLKTAALLAASLKIGAIVGGAAPREAELLYEFGRNLGIAFQLLDDLLDVYADPLAFGKVTGNDIVSNKKTILLVQALVMARGDLRKELLYWMNKVSFEPQDKINHIRQIFDELHIGELTRTKAGTYHEQAFDLLGKLSCSPDRLGGLKQFSEMLMNRIK